MYCPEIEDFELILYDSFYFLCFFGTRIYLQVSIFKRSPIPPPKEPREHHLGQIRQGITEMKSDHIIFDSWLLISANSWWG
jgi:hypothetical protein